MFLKYYKRTEKFYWRINVNKTNNIFYDLLRNIRSFLSLLIELLRVK